MTISRIPLPTGLPAFTQRVQLDQVEYAFEFRWNDRAASWFFLLSDSTGALICSRRLLVNWPLLGSLVRDGRPAGELIALDLQDLGTPIGLNDLGDRIVLDYLDAGEVAALRAGA